MSDDTDRDAIALLRGDHDEFRGVLKRLEDTSERAVRTRDELFATLRAELVAHAAIEEEILYPALQEVGDEDTVDKVQEGYQEHHLMDVLIDELKVLPVGDETWGSKLHVLGESLEHHLKEEERDLFPMARRALSATQLRELGEDMAERRDEVLERIAASGARPMQGKPLEKR